MYSKEQKIIIANWKMNFTLSQAEEYCKKFTDLLTDDNVIFAAPSPYLAYLVNKFPDINFSAQNITSISKDFGAYTGELSARMLRSINIDYVICGHSERRKYFHENDEIVMKMATNILNNDIIPIICIGENSDIATKDRVGFLLNQIDNCVPNSSKSIIIAYEPLWAIGTGVTPTTHEISDIISEIKQYISKVAKNITIVYGGSVNSDNAPLLSKIELLDGVLVGGASLDFVEFMKIVKAYA